MASENKSKVSILTNGIIKENPVLRLVLGTCSCLAVTTAVSSALGMGAAFTFVLVCSNILISLLRNVIPAKVHLPAPARLSGCPDCFPVQSVWDFSMSGSFWTPDLPSHAYGI